MKHSSLHHSFLSMIAIGITLGGLGVVLVQKMDLHVVDSIETTATWDIPDDVPLIAIAQAEVTAIDVDSEILSIVGLDPAQLEWKDVFSNDSPQNLYLKMYDQVKNEAGRAASTKVAENIGYSEDELAKILRFDPTSIATYAAAEHLTYSQAIATFQEVESIYNEELAMQQLASDLEADIYPIEIFANGTTDDSGFDLIVDLANIETILFKDTTITAPGAYGGDTAAGDGTDEDDASSSDTDASDDEEDADDVSSSDDDDGSSSSGDDSSSTDATADDTTAADEEEDDEVESAIACLADTTLSDAIVEAIAEAAGAEMTDDDEDSGGSDSDTEPDTLDSLPDDGTDTSAIEDQQASFDAIAAEVADSWTDETLCVGAESDFFSFCIDISFEYNPKTYYKTSDNCIACHFEQMRDRMATVLEKNLTPNKVTGNIMEGTKCNKGFLASGIDLKIIAIAQPMQTPPNDNVVVGVDPAATLNSLRNALSPGRPIGTQEAPYDPPTGASAALQAQQKFAGTSVSYSTVADEVSKIVGKAEQDAIAAEIEFQLQGSLESTALFYQQMRNNMTDMNIYFLSFLENVKRLLYSNPNATSSTPACEGFKQKESCPK